MNPWAKFKYIVFLQYDDDEVDRKPGRRHTDYIFCASKKECEDVVEFSEQIHNDQGRLLTYDIGEITGWERDPWRKHASPIGYSTAAGIFEPVFTIL